MGRISQLLISIAATLLYCNCCNIQNVDAHPQGLAFINQRSSINYSSNKSSPSSHLLIPRGGSIDDSDYEDEYDSDYEEEEDSINVKKSLASSTLKASTKAKKQKSSSSKKVVNESLMKKKSVKTSKRRLIVIPYILKALLNPFTVFSMTRGYFASLFNINYLEKESSSETLRSALQEKAKKQAGQSGGKKKRAKKFSPGQVKTLSDLPQLNA